MSDGNVISGYAVRFNSPTVIGGAFREQVSPSAFDRALDSGKDIVALLAHDGGRVLGRVSAGTLKLRADSVGLWFEATVDPSTPSGQEALGTISRGDVRGMSFGFVIRSEEWQEDDNRLPLRTLTDVDIFEISAVAFPAYLTTSVGISRAADNDSAARRRIAVRKARMEQRLRGIR